MRKRALRKNFADTGATKVVKPDGRQCTLNHGNVIVERTAAGTGPLEFRRKVERERALRWGR